MDLREIDTSRVGYRNEIDHFIAFSDVHGYSTKMRDINPVHVIEWLRERATDQNASDYLRRNNRFARMVYFIISKSKYPLSLFMKINLIRDLIYLPIFESNVFLKLFDLFLECSKKYATDPKGIEPLRELPTFLSEDRSKIDSWFLTDVSDSFRLSLVVDFYVWLTNKHISINPNDNDSIADALNLYKEHVRDEATSGAFKKAQRLISFILKCLGRYETHTPNREKVDETSKSLIEHFLESKKIGIKISYRDQLVSNTKWKRSGIVNSRDFLYRFICRVYITRNYHQSDILNFNIFTLSLDDFIEVNNSFGLSTKDLNILRQFMAWLLEQTNHPKYQFEFLNNFYTKLPTKGVKHSKDVVGKNWISRYDYITLIRTALEYCEKSTKLRYATYIGLTGFCALRRFEASLLQVGNFVLDKNMLLADFGLGYGKLILPSNKTKGEYSPSIDPYHIAVVPRLRTLINTYLQSTFMKGYNKETFLFRVEPVGAIDTLFENITEKNYSDGEWLSAVSRRGGDIMKQVSKNALPFFKSKIKGNLSSHDLRRSINDFIRKTPTGLSNTLRIAEIHLRHKKSGGVNDIYVDEPTLKEYISCIDNSLNFPWSYQELSEWEQKHHVEYQEFDWDETLGSPKYPSPITTTSEMLEHSYVPFIKTTNYNKAPEKEITKLEAERDELHRELAKKGVNKIALQSKIRRLDIAITKLQRGH